MRQLSSLVAVQVVVTGKGMMVDAFARGNLTIFAVSGPNPKGHLGRVSQRYPKIHKDQ